MSESFSQMTVSSSIFSFALDSHYFEFSNSKLAPQLWIWQIQNRSKTGKGMWERVKFIPNQFKSVSSLLCCTPPDAIAQTTFGNEIHIKICCGMYSIACNSNHHIDDRWLAENDLFQWNFFLYLFFHRSFLCLFKFMHWRSSRNKCLERLKKKRTK